MAYILNKISESKLFRSKYGVWMGYALFFLAAFFLFIFLTFPKDAVLERLKYEVERNTPYTIGIEKADVSPLLDINLNGVVLSLGQNPVVVIDRIDMNPSLYSLLRGRLSLPFKAEVLGGQILGKIEMNGNWDGIQRARIDIKGVDLAETTRSLSRIMANPKSMPILEGDLQGVAEISTDGGPKGIFHFSSSQMGIVELRLKGYQLPSIKKLSASLDGNFLDKTADIKSFTIKGEKLNLRVTGTLPVPWMASRRDRLDLRLRLKTENPKFAILKSFLAREPDGSGSGRIIGTWGRPKFISRSSLGRRKVRRTPRTRRRPSAR